MSKKLPVMRDEKKYLRLINWAQKRAGLTMRIVAERCCISPSYLSKILKGERLPGRDLLCELCIWNWCLDEEETDEILIACGYPPIRRKEKMIWIQESI